MIRFLFMISVLWVAGFSFYLNQRQGAADRLSYSRYVEAASKICEEYNCSYADIYKEASDYAFPKDGQENWRYFYDPLIGAILYLPLIWSIALFGWWGTRKLRQGRRLRRQDGAAYPHRGSAIAASSSGRYSGVS